MMRSKFRNRIEFYRVSRGLSRDRLAFLVGIDSLFIFAYERNSLIPSAYIALRLCRVLAVDFSDLFYFV